MVKSEKLSRFLTGEDLVYKNLTAQAYTEHGSSYVEIFNSGDGSKECYEFEYFLRSIFFPKAKDWVIPCEELETREEKEPLTEVSIFTYLFEEESGEKQMISIDRTYQVGEQTKFGKVLKIVKKREIKI